jgi:hypothetical protein
MSLARIGHSNGGMCRSTRRQSSENGNAAAVVAEAV